MLTRVRNKIYRALRLSEKYTKTDMVYLVKNGGLLMVGRAVSMLSVFLLSVAFANFLPKETYGVYKYIISIVSLLGLFTLSGMGTAVSQSVARGFEGTVKPAINAEIRWGLIGGALGLLIALYYLIRGNQMFAICFGMVGVVLPFTNVYYLYSFVLQGRKMFDQAVKYDSSLQIFYALTAFFALYLTRNIYVVLAVYLMSSSLFQYIVYRLVEKRLMLNDKIDLDAITYGKHLSLMGIIGLVAVADQILVYHFLGPVQLAVYSFAIAPAEQLKGVFKSVMALAMPKFAVQDMAKASVKKGIFRKTILFAAFISIGVLFYTLLAKLFFSTFFPQYMESVVYSQIASVSLVASALFLPYSALQAVGATKELYRFNVGATFVQLTLLFVGVYFFGVIGAVLAKVMTRFIELAYALWLTKNIKKYALHGSQV